jgi:hypothetical protein
MFEWAINLWSNIKAEDPAIVAVVTMLVTALGQLIVRMVYRKFTGSSTAPNLSEMGNRIMQLLTLDDVPNYWQRIKDNCTRKSVCTGVRCHNVSCYLKGSNAFDVVIEGESVLDRLPRKDRRLIKRAAWKVFARLEAVNTANERVADDALHAKKVQALTQLTNTITLHKSKNNFPNV